MFAESLTIRILADSSSFRSDLDSVLSVLDRMRDSVRAVADGGGALASSFAQLSRAAAPLQQISKLLSAIQNQIQSISRTPLTINVDLAMASLAQLAAMVDIVAAKLNTLSSAGGAPTLGGGGGGPSFPSGGFNPYVGNPLPGLPGKLSTMSLPTSTAALASQSQTPTRVANSSTTNNFGGVTIQVRETADVNGLMRDLRLQGIHLRNRRG